MAKLLIALALATPAAAFAPVQTQARAVTSVSAYVPAGLTEAQYKKVLAEKESKKAQNKQKFPKGKNFKDVADWLVEMEAKQTFRGDQVASSGHTYVKEKFSSKAQFDLANNRNDKGYGGKQAASSGAAAPKKKGFFGL